jgi:hypothetical protein
MAKLGMDRKSTAKELLDAWLEYILSDNFKPEQSMNRSISLSVENDLVKRNPRPLDTLPSPHLNCQRVRYPEP